jgi:tRNA (mo5U34)-methyltransferase
MTPEEVRKQIDRLGPWFHQIDLGDNIRTKSASAIGEPLEHPYPTWEKIKQCIPRDLAGKTVLDVGCNAGFYAIEAKRRGAARVLGVDAQKNLIRQAIFVREHLGLDIEYQRLTVYDLDPHQMGQFDITLALGLVYHLKHLVLALEKLFLITRELLVLETAIYPPEITPPAGKYQVGDHTAPIYPLAYVANPPAAKEAIYNWFLPSVDALSALLMNVGFDEVRPVPASQSDRAILVCRKGNAYLDSSQGIMYLAAELKLLEGVTKARAGEVIQFRMKVTNTGYARWLKQGFGENDRGAVHLVAHVLGTDESPISLYHAGAFLPHDVGPNESVEIVIHIGAPTTPGTYLLEFDMLSEHVAWFEDLGSPTVRSTLEVGT